ncbi:MULTISPECIES: hypothetical protein [unclassified Clostridioides]|uniref:hypothetical protein n=1 Tax=unclassified Clostridioides TaxID=2635829 RepID=UPI001D0C49EB|nr:hypothetical protein [Clostridioides sp. ES-S-0001-02]MCC0652449.1 hypothetical protein [Clostridioides sp. ES-S-0001-03]MCC0655121.1 hypothetical protein [Clostridioides sp. ES-S-0123-01]MCC0673080.1 hypothetical protein [Clostridioides sp. ES-S-0145-01]MCC0679714.1 hypothetical protein [Clostridioides sp. ES-S-0005-03]MCC0695148.1 hypothetical protein [Clostridioides sp. ES-S-0048-02]MCC0702193.1 hypothetical protein [Clostridioides sp. ES-S-0049-02]MCC0707953.1 hypothetical protein [Cl
MIKNTKQITVEVNEILLQEVYKMTNNENTDLSNFINESIINYILENRKDDIENKDLEEVINFYKKENIENPKSAARAIAEAKTHTLY